MLKKVFIRQIGGDDPMLFVRARYPFAKPLLACKCYILRIVLLKHYK